MALTIDVPARHHFTRREYYAMSEAGLFVEDVRVELVAGDIIHHPQITPLHASTVMRLSNWLLPRVRDRGIVGVHDPVNIGDDTEPNPDVIIAEYRDDFYRNAHPEPRDVLLAAEVAEVSQDYDHKVKVPLYGQAGIMEMWLVDVRARVLEVYRTPSDIGYRSLLRLTAGDSIAPLAFPDLTLDVAALLPPTAQSS